MTVQTNTNVANFLGNGAATYPIGFKFNSAADLVVQKTVIATGVTTTLTLNSDYSVAGAGVEEGGSITFSQAPTSAESIKVTRVVDLLQLTDLRNQGKFYAEVHEAVFDKLAMIDQQQQTEIDDANAKSDEAVATANEANAKSDQAVAKAAQNLIDMQAQYDAFEQGASFVVIGDYAAGLVVDGYNKIFRKDGEFYRAKAELTLPYPLNGDWATDAPNFVSVGDAVLRQELSGEGGAAMVGYPGYASVLEKLSAGVADFQDFRIDGASDTEAFQQAVTAGSVRVRAGASLTIVADINIPSDRLIVVERGAAIYSSGRFCAHGSNNVHWIIDGRVEATSMAQAPAKAGWPNTADGTQNGDERGFIEFGGVIFGGNDGYGYSVTGSGVVAGPWVGTPNANDMPALVNRKGIAAWNCSGVYFAIAECYGFLGEAIYWHSRSEEGRDVLFENIYSHDHAFNALNINAKGAHRNIVVRNCTTRNSFNGIETSAGDLINTTHYDPVNAGVYFGQGHGGGDRLVSGNKVINCHDTSYKFLYTAGFEGAAKLKTFVITDNLSVNAGINAFAVKDLDDLTFRNNVSIGHGQLATGYAFGFFGVSGGIVSGNSNHTPGGFGTEHLRAINSSLQYGDNPRIDVAVAAPQILVNGGFDGGWEDTDAAVGTKKNRRVMMNPSFDFGCGVDLLFACSNITPPWQVAGVSSALREVSGAGARGSLLISTRKANLGDPLGLSIEINHVGDTLPGVDGGQNIGRADRRFNNSFFAVAPTVTSDENMKDDIRGLSDAELAVSKSLRKEVVAYKLKNAGRSRRTHFGVIAQRVVAAFEAEGLDANDYGLLCYDETESGGIYGVRYEELLAFIIAGI